MLALGGLAACEPVSVHFGERARSQQLLDPPTETLFVDARIVASGVQTCDDPSARETLGRFERRASPNPENTLGNWLWAGGELVADYNGDGFLDIVAPAQPFAKVYKGHEEAVAFDPVDVLKPFDLEFGSGGTSVDYDADGDLDVYLMRYDRSNKLLRNRGNGTFDDVTVEAGLDLHAYPSTTSSWADMDRDGDLDLFVGNYGHPDQNGMVAVDDFVPAAPSFLYENLGDGTFVDRSDMLPQWLHDAYTYAGGWHDLNRDGYPELYVINDFGAAQPNVVMLNVRGTLVPDNNGMGLDLAMSGAGLGVGDLNSDGLPDMIVPQWNDVGLYLSRDGTWIDHAAQRNLLNDRDRGQTVGWGADLSDVDNDGDLDAFVAYGYLGNEFTEWENPAEQPDALYLQGDDGNFEDVAEDWGIADRGSSRGFVVADFNDDGWLDVTKRDLSGPNTIYLSRCGDAGWLRVRLHGEAPNTYAVGAIVAVHAGDRVWERTILAGGTGFASAGPPEVHIGLGDRDIVDRVEVTWPDGFHSTFADVDTRQILDISR